MKIFFQNKGAPEKYAIWALTPKGAELARMLNEKFPGSECFLPLHMITKEGTCNGFDKFKSELTSVFNQFHGHIFIMATGIVIRLIASLIKKKTTDPGVIVMDEKGRHVISLLSGHIGGANRLACEIAKIVNGDPVITTATDINHLTGIDSFAHEAGLFIENPAAIKKVNMAIVEDKEINVHDPYNILSDCFNNITSWDKHGGRLPGIYISDEVIPMPQDEALILRPCILVVGIGCRRGIEKDALMDFLFKVFKTAGLSLNSIQKFATIDLKQDEEGLLSLARGLKKPIVFYSPDELSSVHGVKTPSEIVKHYTGVKSVCEAAALFAANTTQMIVEKQVTKDITIAIARTGFM